MELFSVRNLCKSYGTFALRDVSLSLEEGYIMGFIGRNGAGKTTTLKCMLGLVHRDGGEVLMFGKDFQHHELELKQEIGYMAGGIDYYPKTRIRHITDVARRFYRSWDQGAYEGYLRRFDIDEDKRPSELSQGMRTKYSLAMALSHGARLLILDEPTSGLDPVARDDLLELFHDLVEDGRRGILFSTHITSDLEKCADFIAYIEEGKLLECGELDSVLDSYRLIKGRADQFEGVAPRLIASKRHSFGFTALIRSADLGPGSEFTVETPGLEDIMVYCAKKEVPDEPAAL